MKRGKEEERKRGREEGRKGGRLTCCECDYYYLFTLEGLGR